MYTFAGVKSCNIMEEEFLIAEGEEAGVLIDLCDSDSFPHFSGS